jgi:hypothetical protein
MAGTRCGLRVIEGRKGKIACAAAAFAAAGGVDDMMIVLITSDYKWRTLSGTGS